jgi:NADH-quinone oxidoreductase subunit L
MLITIVLIPVFAALVALLLPGKHAVWPVLSGSAATFLMAGLALLSTLNGEEITTELAGLPGFPYLLHATNFTVAVLFAVTAVAFFIFIYARGYMGSEPGKKAFWSGMSLFLAAMQLLVLSGDWITFIIGWEIMGFASYRLIATWHHKKEARTGANKAFMITRITDMGLYVGIFLIILQTGSSEIAAAGSSVSALAGVALLFAVMGKSAQVPFQSWLSGAMAGPTPVSSFLHSATLVAAGILLMLKAFPLLPAEILPWIGAVGGVTIIMAGLTAVFANDLKQMLAASTSSHLGFMLLAIGAGYPGAAAAHLLAHAFMKSSLFLGAGIWQHAYESTAFSKLKSAGKKFKPTYLLFTLAAVALAGIPPLIGYFSKDAILAAGLKTNATLLYFSAATLGALLTALYMGRALQLLWKDELSETPTLHYANWMKTGMALLVLVVLAGGFLLKPAVKFMNLEMPHSTVAIITGIVAAVTGLAIGWFLLSKEYKNKTARFIRNNYSIAGGYQQLVVVPVLKLVHFINRIEKGIDAGVDFIGAFFYRNSRTIDSADSAIEFVTQLLGNVNLRIGQWTRISDESGLEEAIKELTQVIKNLGSQGKKLQNGLVHREMLWSVVGFISFILILIVINL